MKKLKKKNGSYVCVEYACTNNASEDNPRCPKHSVDYYTPWLRRSMPSSGRTPIYKDDTWD